MMSGTVELQNVKHILLTGQPGSGKTTLIIKVCELLTSMKLPVAGFYTKELRSGNSRTGFDVFTLDNKQGPLARISSNLGQQQNLRAPRVGNYIVDLLSFESIALPALCNQDSKSVLVIDEIGKMELFSQRFECRVKELFQKKNLVILATIPNKGKPITLVETLKKLPSAAVIEVNIKNRDNLPDTIASSIRNTYETILTDT